MIALRRVPGTETMISRLGFGCVRLTSCASERAAIRTLDAALDCGITHFDTARVYGLGHSERILGKFLRGKRSRVTVATKFGFAPSATVLNQPILIRTVKKVLGPFPKLLRRADKFGRGQAASPTAIPRGTFDLQQTKKSIDQSLKALGTDYIDVLLMHEATIADANSEDILQFLNSLVTRGIIRSFGVASDFAKLGTDANAFDERHRVFQFDHSAAKPNISAMAHTSSRLILTFQHLNPMRALRLRLQADHNLARTFSDQLGVDLTAPQNIANLLQQYALKTNPAGAVLFSSTSPDNIRQNARHAERDSFSLAQLETFASLARSETSCIATPAPSNDR